MVFREGIHESRTGLEDCVGGGGVALFGLSLSVGDVERTVSKACSVLTVSFFKPSASPTLNPVPYGSKKKSRALFAGRNRSSQILGRAAKKRANS
jgi:hypothetical protein